VKMAAKRRITQHKRFVPYGTCPNPALLGWALKYDGQTFDNSRAVLRVCWNDKECLASFMLETLSAIAGG